MRSGNRKARLSIVFAVVLLAMLATAHPLKRVGNGSGSGGGTHTGLPGVATIPMHVP